MQQQMESAPALASERPLRQRKSQSENAPIRVLVVEDSPTQAQFLLHLLSQAPRRRFDATVAGSVAEAREFTGRQEFDVALLDLWLPDASELESLRQVRAFAPALPVVVQTGRDDVALGMEAVKCGAQDYLTKSELSPGLVGRVLAYAIEREQVRQTLQEGEARLTAMAQNVPGIVYQKIVEPDGAQRYSFIGGPALAYYGVEAEDIVRDPDVLLSLMEPADVERLRDLTQRAAARCEPYDIELRHRMPDGTTRWKLVRASPKRLPGGAVAFDGLSLDISERKRAEEAWRETEKRLRQTEKLDLASKLAGRLAHDFNNRLTVILGSLELLLEGSGSEDRRERLLKAAQRSAAGAAVLAQRLLGLSYSKPIDPRVLNVSDTLSGLAQRARELLGQDVTLSLNPDRECWPVLANPEKLEEAILALVQNAAEALPEGGTVTIECMNSIGHGNESDESTENDHVIIAVRDTGTGMPPEVANRALEPFFTTKSSSGAVGLGLPMVFGFARQHGGTVRIESAPLKGTCVTVWLPRYDVKSAAETGELSTARTAKRNGPARILVVEDNEEVRELAVSALDAEDWKILEAAGGDEALAVLDRVQEIDLLFTDIEMPGDVNGYELAKIVRERWPEIPILLTSGYAEQGPEAMESDKIKAKWLAKPYSLADLHRQVTELL